MIPYQNLYIYEISGEISGAREFFKEDYIGCWNEGEVSFLFFSRPHDEEVERWLNQKTIKTFQKFKEQDWVTIVGLKFY